MDLANYIDHTLLSPDARQEDIIKLCNEAKKYNFHSVCVQPPWVSLCKNELKGSNVKVCAVAAFPQGLSKTHIKLAEVMAALADGADEVDIVMNIAWAKNNMWWEIRDEIATIVTGSRVACLKVIIETCLLDNLEIMRASKEVNKAGAHFVKTSTGFSKGGATLDAVRLMRVAVGTRFGIKASGGIRTLKDALAMIEAGATRLGTSASVSIMEEEIQNKKK